MAHRMRKRELFSRLSQVSVSQSFPLGNARITKHGRYIIDALFTIKDIFFLRNVPIILFAFSGSGMRGNVFISRKVNLLQNRIFSSNLSFILFLCGTVERSLNTRELRKHWVWLLFGLATKNKMVIGKTCGCRRVTLFKGSPGTIRIPCFPPKLLFYSLQFDFYIYDALPALLVLKMWNIWQTVLDMFYSKAQKSESFNTAHGTFNDITLAPRSCFPNQTMFYKGNYNWSLSLLKKIYFYFPCVFPEMFTPFKKRVKE